MNRPLQLRVALNPRGWETVEDGRGLRCDIDLAGGSLRIFAGDELVRAYAPNTWRSVIRVLEDKL